MLKAFQSVLVAALATFAAQPGTGFADELSPTPSAKPADIQAMPAKPPGSVGLMLDFAKVLTLDHAARTIVIGNPGIVDGAISDPRTVVLTGKAAGTTNIIVLGQAGQEISNLIVHVATSDRQTTFYAGAAPTTFSCVGICTPTVSPGDDNGFFDTSLNQIKSRQEFAGERTTGQR